MHARLRRWIVMLIMVLLVTVPMTLLAAEWSEVTDGRLLEADKDANAKRQARLEAGATQERTLEGVACRPMIGIQSCFQCYCAHLAGRCQGKQAHAPADDE